MSAVIECFATEKKPSKPLPGTEIGGESIILVIPLPFSYGLSIKADPYKSVRTTGATIVYNDELFFLKTK